MGLVTDHVHVLLRLEPVFCVPKLVQSLEGTGARLSKRDDERGRGLRWAKGYQTHAAAEAQMR